MIATNMASKLYYKHKTTILCKSQIHRTHGIQGDSTIKMYRLHFLARVQQKPKNKF